MADPWSEGLLAAELAAPGGIGLGIEDRGELCGYAFFRTCLPESELLRLAVAPARRRQGLASQLLNSGLRTLADQGCDSCFLEVRAANQGALALYARSGFVPVGRRKNYYSQPVEDALQLARRLTATSGEISR